MSDFAPIMRFASGVTGVVVKSSSPWKTLPEFIEFAKTNSRRTTYATSRAGSTMHVAMQYIEERSGIKWTHVPYPGARDTLAAVLGGHIDAAVGSTQWANDVRAGSLRLLAIIGDERMKAFPDVPTIKELGYNFTAHTTSLLVAPNGTPTAAIGRLDDAFRQAMDDPEFIQTVKGLELNVSYRNPDDLRRYLESASRDYAQIIDNLGIATEFNQK
jgi:tripartite-type tricarboxylate transporter receptor subunit TctC